MVCQCAEACPPLALAASHRHRRTRDDPRQCACTDPSRSHVQGLLSLLRNLKKDSEEFRILMLGLDNSGKTTALKNLAGVRPPPPATPPLPIPLSTLRHPLGNWRTQVTRCVLCVAVRRCESSERM